MEQKRPPATTSPLEYFHFHERIQYRRKDTNWSSMGNPFMTFNNKFVVNVDVLPKKMKERSTGRKQV